MAPRTVDDLRHLVAAAAETDGVGPLSDDAALRLTTQPLTAAQHLIVTVPSPAAPADVPASAASQDGEAAASRNDAGTARDHDAGTDAGTIAGYAHLAAPDDHDWQAEVVVHPAHRRQGVGGHLLAALTTAADQAGADLHVWAHGDTPAAATLADRYGFARQRVLWQMRRPLPTPGSPDERGTAHPDNPVGHPPGPRPGHFSGPDVPPLPDVTPPPGVAIRTFVPGQDEDAWVVVNSAAFATHPEQGRWTVEDLRLREAEPWFDPAGFFLAEAAGQLVGFHWTKVEAGIGEVYVVGVAPTAAGRGLGRVLTLIGLHHLRDRGLATVMLYVDDTNRPAVRLYETLGFSRYRCDISYLRRPRVQPESGSDRP
ncbi:hypothetical protein FrCorBMG51_17910 [Protofrankia coriariae]|uniref:Mycothiol acetyltransferase n=1 Tax=Protofrankia coriariae TaxID=1562887 RepID=A0ABR5F1D1_9ACTN|nr:hypothetical protein FrCorBMG51_17910 [Protofrankia coriariae]